MHCLRRPARCALSQTSRCRVQQHQQRCNTRLPIAAVCLQQPACRLQAGAQHRHPGCTDCRFCAFRVRIVEVLRILAGKLALILHGARQYLQTDGAVSLSLLASVCPQIHFLDCSQTDSLFILQLPDTDRLLKIILLLQPSSPLELVDLGKSELFHAKVFLLHATDN